MRDARDFRHNVVALGLDYGLFMVALALASPQTVIPAFAAHLGASNLVIGAIPAVMTLGWFLPSLFVAGYTTSLPRKLPFILRHTVWERVPFLALAGVAFLVAPRAPVVALALVPVLLLVLTVVGGLLMPAWMDLIGRAVPTTLRGRFFATANSAGNAAGFVAGLGVTWVLAAVKPPASYGICFLGATLFVGLSYIALAVVREPPPAAAPPASLPLRAHLARSRDLLRREANLRWFLMARTLGVMGTMATGFYAVAALRVHGAADWHVGVFTTALLFGEVVGGLLLGWLADRAGHRLVVMASFAASAAANAVALLVPSLDVFPLVFALAGVQIGAISVSGLSVLLEFAPEVGEQPIYIGLGSTALAPASLVAPLLAGYLADAAGFPALFATALAFGAGALALLLSRVRDPRHVRV
jgi:MFS family permease